MTSLTDIRIEAGEEPSGQNFVRTSNNMRRSHPGRRTTFDAALAGSLDTVATLENAVFVDSLAIVDRGNVILYENRSRSGMWDDRRMTETIALRCPKCGKNDLSLVEVQEWTILYKVVGGQVDMSDRDNEPGGIVRLEATCQCCGHHWKPRGATMIDHVVVGLKD